MTFAPGDIVTLKSGGHPMTVVSVDAEEIDCLWLGDAGELFRQLIPAIALTMLEQSESEDADEEADEDDDEEGDEDEEDTDEDDERDEKRRA